MVFGSVYLGCLVAIALVYPSIAKAIASTAVWLSCCLALTLFGALSALLVAKRYISDPANQGHFLGPDISSAADGSTGFRRVVFTEQALAPELWQVAEWMGWALAFLAASLAIQFLCATIDKEKLKKHPGRKRRNTGAGQDDSALVPDHPSS